MQKRQAESKNIRLAEVVAALSLATDLGMGQPLEYALQVCILSVRLAEALGYNDEELRETYYLALLRHIGCNAETYTMASLFGDELALRTDFASVDSANNQQALGIIMRTIRQSQQGSSPLHIARMLAQAIMTSQHVMRDEFNGFCEVAERLAERLGFGENILRALGQVFQRWDGRGLTGAIKGDQIVSSMRVVGLAQDAVTFFRLDGVEAAVTMAKERRGAAYDPAIVDCFCQQASKLMMGFGHDPSWEEVLALEPGAHPWLSESQFDQACQAMAYFTDIKSPYTLTHSSGVAELAASATRRCGLPESDVVTIRRAALLHDIGRSGISAGTWGKPGPLSEREWAPPTVSDAVDLFYSILSADGGRNFKLVLGRDKRDPRIATLELFGRRSRPVLSVIGCLLKLVGQDGLAALLRNFGHRDTLHYWQLVEEQMAYQQRFLRAIDTDDGGPFDLILCPACALPALTHGSSRDLGVAGGYTALYNLLGYPTGIVPLTRVRSNEEVGRSPSRDMVEQAALKVERGSAGLPVGVQVVARPWREHVALAAMQAIEEVASARQDYPGIATVVGNKS